jgi:hypothetical protein
MLVQGDSCTHGTLRREQAVAGASLSVALSTRQRGEGPGRPKDG